MSAAPSFAAEEITEAYAAFHEQVAGFTAAGDWDGYADLVTPDADDDVLAWLEKWGGS